MTSAARIFSRELPGWMSRRPRPLQHCERPSGDRSSRLERAARAGAAILAVCRTPAYQPGSHPGCERAHDQHLRPVRAAVHRPDYARSARPGQRVAGPGGGRPAARRPDPGARQRVRSGCRLPELPRVPGAVHGRDPGVRGGAARAGNRRGPAQRDHRRAAGRARRAAGELGATAFHQGAVRQRSGEGPLGAAARRFAFIVGLGDGQEWSNGKMDAPRFFCYWQEPQLRDVLSAAGFAGIDIRRASGPGGKLDHLQVVATS